MMADNDRLDAESWLVSGYDKSPDCGGPPVTPAHVDDRGIAAGILAAVTALILG